VNALANPELGKYLNENFVSSFQKVATFRIVNGGQKQGGNVASYFCAADGRVLHVVAGPVDAATLLREAKWVVETSRKVLAESKGDGAAFKALFRKAHAERLRQEFGLVVEPVTYDPPAAQEENSALSYRDPSGRPLAPVLPPPPIEGPDVSIRAARFAAGQGRSNLQMGLVQRIRPGVVSNQARAHALLAAHALVKIEKVYGSIFEGILGEKVTTKPVEIVTPFPWVTKRS
jgi:hypothetical protein